MKQNHALRLWSAICTPPTTAQFKPLNASVGDPFLSRFSAAELDRMPVTLYQAKRDDRNCIV